jgi:hypothetical protein
VHGYVVVQYFGFADFALLAEFSDVLDKKRGTLQDEGLQPPMLADPNLETVFGSGGKHPLLLGQITVPIPVVGTEGGSLQSSTNVIKTTSIGRSPWITE